MSFFSTDIRTSTDQRNSFIEAVTTSLPSETTHFIAVGKMNSLDNFSVEIFAPNFTADALRGKIICSLRESTLQRVFNSGKFRLEDYEFTQSTPFTFYYTVSYLG